jgi:hypothetical protein
MKTCQKELGGQLVQVGCRALENGLFEVWISFQPAGVEALPFHECGTSDSK